MVIRNECMQSQLKLLVGILQTKVKCESVMNTFIYREAKADLLNMCFAVFPDCVTT